MTLQRLSCFSVLGSFRLSTRWSSYSFSSTCFAFVRPVARLPSSLSGKLWASCLKKSVLDRCALISHDSLNIILRLFRRCPLVDLRHPCSLVVQLENVMSYIEFVAGCNAGMHPIRKLNFGNSRSLANTSWRAFSLFFDRTARYTRSVGRTSVRYDQSEIANGFKADGRPTVAPRVAFVTVSRRFVSVALSCPDQCHRVRSTRPMRAIVRRVETRPTNHSSKMWLCGRSCTDDHLVTDGIDSHSHANSIDEIARFGRWMATAVELTVDFRRFVSIVVSWLRFDLCSRCSGVCRLLWNLWMDVAAIESIRRRQRFQVFSADHQPNIAGSSD